MKVKKLTKDRLLIPEWNGNRDLPKEEQIEIDITKFPTVSESGSYKKMSFTGDGSIAISYPNDATMLLRHVGNIKNLEDDEVISNGKALSSSDNLIFEGLITEIRTYILEAAELLELGEK